MTRPWPLSHPPLHKTTYWTYLWGVSSLAADRCCLTCNLRCYNASCLLRCLTVMLWFGKRTRFFSPTYLLTKGWPRKKACTYTIQLLLASNGKFTSNWGRTRHTFRRIRINFAPLSIFDLLHLNEDKLPSGENNRTPVSSSESPG